MALSLGVRKGDKFFVGHQAVEVMDIQGHTYAILRINGTTMVIDDQKSVEILPQVFVSCGKPSGHRIERHAELVAGYHNETQRRMGMSPAELEGLPNMVPLPELLPRLLVEAPRSITILREELYVRDKG